ncbi:MAG TPA: hypothetical protein VFS67_10205 [Polyangiaceae bacterium]|nr:hypothetical protein [Polyangiaceae bacterium]
MRAPSRFLLFASPLLAGVFGASCGVDSTPLFNSATPLQPSGGRPGNLPIFTPLPNGAGTGEGTPPLGGLGESTVGATQQHQEATDAGSGDAGALGDGGTDAGACAGDADCIDNNPCTVDDCVGGRCQHGPTDRGVLCGSATANECTQPDTCDGAGSCQPNHLPAGTACGRLDNTCAADTCDGAGSCVAHNLATGMACAASSGCGQPTCNASGTCERHDAPNGSACTGGSCAVGACVEGQRVGCPQAVVTAVPFQTDWSSSGLPNLFTGSCQSARTPDYAVELVVPQTGRYRFEASGSPDSMVSLSRGACAAGNGTEISCNDDISNGTNRSSRLDATLTAGDTITVYVSEFGDGNSGSGALRISAL